MRACGMRNRLASLLRRWAGRLDPAYLADLKMRDKAREVHFKELKAAWRALDEKNREIASLKARLATVATVAKEG